MKSEFIQNDQNQRAASLIESVRQALTEMAQGDFDETDLAELDAIDTHLWNIRAKQLG